MLKKMELNDLVQIKNEKEYDGKRKKKLEKRERSFNKKQKNIKN